MNNNKIVVGIILGVLILLGGTVYLATKIGVSSQVEKSVGAKVEVKETSWEWGDIGINDGKVEKEFEIKNVGSEVLKIYNVATSCMCTTAQFVGDGVSPIFGMHAKSSYVKEIKSGETASLKVVFDPLFHGPEGIGPMNRQITMATNDPVQGNLNFMLTATVRK